MSSEVHRDASPVAQFISEVIEPQRDAINVWQDVKKHQDILLEDVQKRRKVTANKLGSGFLLKRDGQRIGGLDAGVTTLVSSQALQATQSLQTCHEYLRASGVPTPSGRFFHVTDRLGAEAYRVDQSGSVAIKPGAYLGKPVISLQASSSDELHREWDRCAASVGHLRSARQQLYVQNSSSDLSLRLFVVGEDLVAAIVRLPFYLIGDGTSSVTELLNAERGRRLGCDYLGRRLPDIGDEYLAAMGLTVEHVLAHGEISFLPVEPPGAAGGGLCVDVLNEIGSRLKDLAIDAMWAFPGLSATAVDIRTASLDGADGALVDNVVPQANHTEFAYPAYGDHRYLGKKLIDHMVLRI